MERLAWQTAWLLQPYDSDGTVTPARLLGKPSGSAAEVESLLGLPSSPDAAYEEIMRRQAERKRNG